MKPLLNRFFQAHLQRVIPGVADGLIDVHAAKLRERPQKACAGCRRPEDWVRFAERIREVLAEVINCVLVAYTT